MALIHAVQHARWEVIWIGERGGKVRKKFGPNLVEAQRLYLKARDAGKKGVTLRCTNVGFPPPEKYLPREVIVTRRVNGRKKRFKKTIVPMKAANARGIWWCPYCMEMRRFETVDGFTYDGIRVEEKRHVCPVCEINVTDVRVREYNPMAAQVEFSLRGRSGKKKGRGRSRRLARERRTA